MQEDITMLRDQVETAHKEFDLIDDEQATKLTDIIDEIENLSFSNSPVLACSRMRRELERQGWTLDEFFQTYDKYINEESGEICPTADLNKKDIAINVAGSALYEIRNNDEITEEDFNELQNQFILGIHAALYNIAIENSEKPIDNPIQDLQAIA